MYKIMIRTDRERYPVFLDQGIIGSIGSIMSRYLPGRPVLVVSDHNVSALYAEECLESLRRAGFKPYLEVLEAGEYSKTLQSAAYLYTKALEAGLDRRSAVVALGGGVSGDLAGFVAATYLRGLPYVQVPTTLLAMVDSSVGGKVAVNHPLGKNLIGSFYQPTMVISDISTLKTLPRREFNAGWAELTKYGVACSKKLFERLEKLSGEIPIIDGMEKIGEQRLMGLIVRAIAIKGAIVFRDETEKNLRRVLNFGHTFGHALESATDYSYYRHGEAVACGMAMATKLALQLKKINVASAQRIMALLKRIKRPLPPGDLDPDAILAALCYDKKKEGETLVFVLPSSLGKAFIHNNPPLDLIKNIIEEYLCGTF